MASIATCDASENSNGLLVVEPPTPLKNMSWDDDISNWMEKIKAVFQTSKPEKPDYHVPY